MAPPQQAPDERGQVVRDVDEVATSGPGLYAVVAESLRVGVGVGVIARGSVALGRCAMTLTGAAGSSGASRSGSRGAPRVFAHRAHDLPVILDERRDNRLLRSAVERREGLSCSASAQCVIA